MNGTPNVFLGWSGEKSKSVAMVFRDYLRLVVPLANPWMSQTDIRKGTAWREELRNALDSCKISIVFVTRENAARPWINFEAGAIYRSYADARLNILLIDIDRVPEGPFEAFQTTVCTESDVRTLCMDIADALGDARADAKLRFALLWEHLDPVIKSVRAQKATPTPSEAKLVDQEDMLQSIQEDIRTLVRRSSELDSKVDALAMRVMNAGTTGGTSNGNSLGVVFSAHASTQTRNLAIQNELPSTEAFRESIRFAILSFAKTQTVNEQTPIPVIVRSKRFRVTAKLSPDGREFQVTEVVFDHPDK